LARAVIVLVSGVVLASGLGCNQDGPLTDGEMDQLRAFMLPAQLPDDPSNSFANDPAAAQLGKMFYFEPRFSGPLLAPYNVATGANGALGAANDTGKVSCASCHDPGNAGVDRRSVPNATSLGAGYTLRNAPTVINAAYSPLWQFWDGRVDSLWGQALGPPEGTAECNSSRLAIAHLIADKYKDAYNQVFGASYPLPDLSNATRFPLTGKPGDGSSFDTMATTDKDAVNRIYANFGKAIAAYERQLVSNNFNPSPFDQFMTGNKDAMSPAAIRGARLFVGHAGCAECHRGAMFSDYAFHNVGAPQAGQYVSPTDNGRISGILSLTSNVFNRGGAYSDDTNNTSYLSVDTTQLPDFMTGQFKTPSLRNVSKTAPYMHDGVYQTLWDVVNHYNFGGETGNYAGEKDPAISPLMLSDAELSDLVEFLEALSDGPINGYVADATLLEAPALPQ
jgi:cytochrome c peroxidase